jgi:uncharacterized protein YndB with AHSA1/START domain
MATDTRHARTDAATDAATDAPTARRLQVRRVYAAPPERIFRAWTTARELMHWHAPGPLTCSLAEVDLRVGGSYRIHMRQPDGTEHRVGGTYRVVEPPHRVVFTWVWDHDPVETLVTIECLPNSTGTELVLTHEGFANEERRANHEQGWTSIVDKLASALA